MAQLNIYVPNTLEKTLRLHAKKKRKSLSAYLAEVLAREFATAPSWPKDYFTKVLGNWQGDFPEIDRPLPEDRESW